MFSTIVDRIANNQKPSSLSSRLREKRFSRFLTLFNVNSKSTILDVGGTRHIWMDTGLETNVTLLNLTTSKPEDINRGFKCVQGNALNMDMFEDKSFDVVFSNSVIEHVGSIENQRQFANEVQRIGKAYWVQTPNKMFPIEPHFLFPFFQFFPVKIQKKIALKWKFSHFKKWDKDANHILDAITNTRLLSRREILELFNDAKLYEEKIFGLTKSFVAYKKE